MPAVPGVTNNGVILRGLSSLPSATEMLTVDPTGVMGRQTIPVGAFGSLTGLPSDNAALSAALAGKVALSGDTMTGKLRVPAGDYFNAGLEIGSSVGMYDSSGLVVRYGGQECLQLNQSELSLRSSQEIGWTGTTAATGAVDSKFVRNGTGQADFRGDSGFRIRNLANSAAANLNCASVACTEIDFGFNLGFARKITPQSYGVLIPGNSTWEGSFTTGNNKVTLNSGVSLCYNAAGGDDLQLVRGGTTYDTANLDVRAANGLRIRNLVNNAFTALQSGPITTTGRVDITSSDSIRLNSASASDGGVIAAGSTGFRPIQLGGGAYNSNGLMVVADGSYIGIRNTGGLYWVTSTNPLSNPAQTAIISPSAGIVEINNGTAGQTRDLSCRAIAGTGNIALTGANPQLRLGAVDQGFVEYSSGALNLGHTYATRLAINASQVQSLVPITAANGTLTASAPVLNLSQTWNNAAVAFNAIDVNVTNTASAIQSTFATFRRDGSNRIVLYDRYDNVAQGAGVQFGSGVVQEAAGGHVALGTTGDAGMVGLTNGLGLSMHPSRWIGWGSTGSATRDQGSAWTDVRMYRGSGPSLQVNAAGGLRVLNLAGSADAPLTCGALMTTGRFTSTNDFDVVVPAVASQRETIFRARVSDAANDAFHIHNATSVDGSFVAGFSGSRFSSNLLAMAFIAQTDSANDTGTEPLMLFQARRTTSQTDPNNGTLSAIVTRPLFSWQTHGAEYMRMFANGNLALNSTTDNGSKFQVSGSMTATGEIRGAGRITSGIAPGLGSGFYITSNGVDVGSISASDGAMNFRGLEGNGNRYRADSHTFQNRDGTGFTNVSANSVIANGDCQVHGHIAPGNGTTGTRFSDGFNADRMRILSTFSSISGGFNQLRLADNHDIAWAANIATNSADIRLNRSSAGTLRVMANNGLNIQNISGAWNTNLTAAKLTSNLYDTSTTDQSGLDLYNTANSGDVNAGIMFRPGAPMHFVAHISALTNSIANLSNDNRLRFRVSRNTGSSTVSAANLHQIMQLTAEGATITPFSAASPVTVSSAANVGIGTSNPNVGLVIRRSGTDLPSLRLEDGDVTVPMTGIGINPTLNANTVSAWAANSSVDGGAQMNGFCANNANATPMNFIGYHGSASPVAPALVFRANKSNGGTGVSDLSGTELIAGFYAGNGASSPSLSIAANGTISASSLSLTGTVTHGFQPLVANPSTVDITNGLIRAVKNTTSGELRFWANDGNVMKSVLFS